MSDLSIRIDALEKKMYGVKKKFVLEFDEEPALVFVQKKAGDIRNSELYQDGKAVKGWRTVNIHAGLDEQTEHEIEYVTGCTK